MEQDALCVELGFVQQIEGSCAIDDPDWHEWDGGRVGGRPVSTLVLLSAAIVSVPCQMTLACSSRLELTARIVTTCRRALSRPPSAVDVARC